MQAHGSNSHKRLKQKKDAEASSFNVAGTGLEPVSESACAPRRSGYEPYKFPIRLNKKRMPKHPLSM